MYYCISQEARNLVVQFGASILEFDDGARLYTAAAQRKDLRIIWAYNVLRNTLYEKEDGNTYGAVVVVVVVVPININAVALAKKAKYIATALYEKRETKVFFFSPVREKICLYIPAEFIFIYSGAVRFLLIIIFFYIYISPPPFFFLCTYTAAVAPYTHTKKKKRDEVAKGNKNTLLFLLFLPGDP